jgi:hypothetical protein
MCEDFGAKFGDKITGCCIMTTHCLKLRLSVGNFFTKSNMAVVPHPPYFSVSPIEDTTEWPPFWHNWGDGDRIADSAEHRHRTRLPGCIYKVAKALGTVHTRGRGLLQGWWWPVGPKLVYDQMAAPVPEIMCGSLCHRVCPQLTQCVLLREQFVEWVTCILFGNGSASG